MERFNQTLQGMLVKFIDKKKESWEDYLDTCVYAYNTSKHESSKYSPFEVMFGRQAVLPVDLNVAKRCSEPLQMESIDDELLQSQIERIQARLESVKANILKAQQKQKEQYDRKHCKPEVYKIGAHVWKKDFTQKKRAGGKLDSKWVGPYVITQSMGRGLYRLQDVKNPTKVVNRVHGIHLKPCLLSVDEVSCYQHCFRYVSEIMFLIISQQQLLMRNLKLLRMVFLSKVHVSHHLFTMSLSWIMAFPFQMMEMVHLSTLSFHLHRRNSDLVICK